MTTSNRPGSGGFIEKKKKKKKKKRKGKKQANIASADRSDGVGLARPASVVGKKNVLTRLAASL